MSTLHTSYYFRSEIVSFYELSEAHQAAALSDNEAAQDSSFVVDTERNEALPLDSFMRINQGPWCGAWGMTYFSAFYIAISRDGSDAVVAYKYSA